MVISNEDRDRIAPCSRSKCRHFDEGGGCGFDYCTALGDSTRLILRDSGQPCMPSVITALSEAEARAEAAEAKVEAVREWTDRCLDVIDAYGECHRSKEGELAELHSILAAKEEG